MASRMKSDNPGWAFNCLSVMPIWYNKLLFAQCRVRLFRVAPLMVQSDALTRDHERKKDIEGSAMPLVQLLHPRWLQFL